MNDHAHDHSDAFAEKKFVDPVCGIAVKPDTPHRAAHDGAAFFFCSAGCKAKFVADPMKYIKDAEPTGAARASHDHGSHDHSAPSEGAAAAPKPGVKWTCPMHPQIVRDGPGACPICGMALEPMTPAAEQGPNPELADMQRRFVVSAIISAPVLQLEMGRHLFGIDQLAPPTLNPWLQFALATPVVLWGGWPFFVRGWASLRSRSLNMFTLIALGTGVAWIYSVVATLAPAAFPAAFRNAHGVVAVYFEAAAVITVLVLLGQVLELRARERTSGAIRALLDLAPKMARRLRDGAEEEIRSTRFRSAISCVCARVRRCRWIPLFAMGARRSTNPW